MSSLFEPNAEERALQFSGRHAIETPEQIALEFAVAGIGSRFLAMLVDTLVQFAVTLVVGLIVLWAAAKGVVQIRQAASLWVMAGVIALFFLLYFGYFAVFEMWWGGQTPGKRLVGIRVMKETGRPLTPAEVVARNLLRIVDQMPGFYAVGVIVAMCNAQSKRLGDFVAGAVVVREHSLAEMGRVWDGNAATGEAMGGKRLTAEEVALVEAFLARRRQLTPDVRARMGEQVLKRVGVEVEYGVSVERTLEGLVRGGRG